MPEGFAFERGVWTTRCSGGVSAGVGVGSCSVDVVGVVISTSSSDVAVGSAWMFRYSRNSLSPLYGSTSSPLRYSIICRHPVTLFSLQMSGQCRRDEGGQGVDAPTLMAQFT